MLRLCSRRHFSEFKTKLEVYKTRPYDSVQAFYHDLLTFQKTLTSNEMLKLEKAMPQFDRKLKNIIKNKHQSIDDFLAKHHLHPSRTFQYIYSHKYELEKYNKVGHVIETMPLYQLSKSIHNLNNDSQYYHSHIINMPFTHKSIWKVIQTRVKNLEEQLCLNIFEGYDRVLGVQVQEGLDTQKEMLKKLMKKQSTFKKEFKFQLKKHLTLEDHEIISKLCRILNIFGCCSPKISIIAQKVLDRQQLTNPQIIRNHLFNLSFHQNPLYSFEEKLYDISQQSIQNSMQILFYMLVFQIQNMITIKELSQKIKGFQPKGIFEIKLYNSIRKLLKIKYHLNIGPEMHMENKQSEIHQIFQEYLTYQQYPYEKVPNQYGDDTLFRIEGKNFLCLGLEKFNANEKTNGLGFVSMQMFKQKEIGLKIVNILKVLSMKKRNEKFEYFKTKMKGIRKPVKVIQKRYDF